MNVQIAKESCQPSTGDSLGNTNKRSYDNTLEAQQARILRWLRQKPQLTTFEARARGIVHPAGRIKELREKGVKILTHWTTELDTLGNPHRIAKYVYCGTGAREVKNAE